MYQNKIQKYPAALFNKKERPILYLLEEKLRGSYSLDKLWGTIILSLK